MDVQLDVDPALFGVWPKVLVYDGLALDRRDEALEAQAWAAVLDTKAETVSPLDDLQDMLNGMTKELRMQLQQFQGLREQAAERALVDTDEIDRKQTQADAKASIEAMSLIVRTLEKIDSLQRTIAHDRQIAAETAFDDEKYSVFAAELDHRIEQRARQLAAERTGIDGVHVSGADPLASVGDDCSSISSTGPPDAAAGPRHDPEAERD